MKSHICIFPSDGTSRIRFTGQGSQPTLSRFTGSPKTLFFMRSGDIIAKKRKMSTGIRKVKSRYLPDLLRLLLHPPADRQKRE